MDQKIRDFIFQSLSETFGFINPLLTNYENFSQLLAKEVKQKSENNIQYNFDVALDEIIKKNVDKHSIKGRIFSEESGFFSTGDEYRIVYDPFCNSTLASKGFADAAVGITVFSFDYKLITSAILDYQNGILAIIEDNQTNFYQIQSRNKLIFSYEEQGALENSTVVVTLENQKEREHLAETEEILQKARRIIISSGHIYWLRLAIGSIDAYLDPFGGEKLYEMFACTVAQKAGCTVTNINGTEFDAGEYLKIFEKDQKYIFYPVGARTKQLHEQLLNSLNKKA